MDDREDFLAWVSSKVKEAEIAVHNGDASPRRSIWSRREPVTVFGAWKSVVGRPDVDKLFSLLERSFSGCTSYAYEIIAADVSCDLAYTVGYEHTQAIVKGEPHTYTLRATQIYRREGGEWKVVHRHGDAPPTEG